MATRALPLSTHNTTGPQQERPESVRFGNAERSPLPNWLNV